MNSKDLEYISNLFNMCIKLIHLLQIKFFVYFFVFFIFKNCSLKFSEIFLDYSNVEASF